MWQTTLPPSRVCFGLLTSRANRESNRSRWKQSWEQQDDPSGHLGMRPEPEMWLSRLAGTLDTGRAFSRPQVAVAAVLRPAQYGADIQSQVLHLSDVFFRRLPERSALVVAATKEKSGQSMKRHGGL